MDAVDFSANVAAARRLMAVGQHVETDDLEPGPEFDRAIADFFGRRRLKPYSTNWGEAMQAAEDYGLFDRHDLSKWGDDWVIVVRGLNGVPSVGRGRTGPEAICRAILEPK